MIPQTITVEVTEKHLEKAIYEALTRLNVKPATYSVFSNSVRFINRPEGV
jgi:hypothetical protein